MNIRNNDKDKKIKNKNEKISNNLKFKFVIKDKKKFKLFLSAFLGIVVFITIVVTIILNLKVEITPETDISSLNAKRYKNEIKIEYEKQENEKLFLEDWENVQNNVGKYFIENYSIEKKEVNDMIKSINNTLDTENWNMIEIEKPIKWNGTWKIDESGNVIFKFKNKFIEPSWANKLSKDKKIELN